MARQRGFWDKFWRDERGRDVIWQRPNKLLLLWFICVVVGIFVQGGHVGIIVGWIGIVSIFLWAVLEFIWGANYFRRLVGVCVVIIIFFAKII